MTNYEFKTVTVSKVIPKHETMILNGIFSKNELLVLQKIIEGFTHAEISGQVSQSKRTIDGIASRLRKKMGCVSNIQVVVKALNEGMFVFNSEVKTEIVFVYCVSS